MLRDFCLFKPNLINMNVHSDTCSCSVELYKLWYTLADFLPNWDISRGFLYILTINVPLFKKLRDLIFFCGIRGGEIVKGEIEEGGCEETFLCLSLT